MTLIVSCAAKDSIVQVSDRRLSMPDGSLVDDAANKAICLWCLDAHVALGYAGLATISGVSTDRWLCEVLLSLAPHTRTLAELGAALSDRLTIAFRRLRGISNRHLTVVLTGYLDGTPFWGSVSNQMGPNGENLDVPMDAFAPLAVPTPLGRARKAFLAVSGELRALPTASDARIKKRQRRYYHQSPYVTAGELVSLVRISARTEKYGAYIGQDCTAIVVLPNGRFRCRAYPQHATPVNFMPNFLFGPAVLEEVTIDVGRPARKTRPT